MRTLGQFVRLAALTVIACFGSGYAGSMPSPRYFEGMARTAGEGESEIVVSRPSRLSGAVVKVRVFVDGQERLLLGNGEMGRVTVPDGRHSVYVNHAGASVETGSKRAITVDAAGSRIVFEVKYGDRGWSTTRALLSKYMEVRLDDSNAPPPRYDTEEPLPEPVMVMPDMNLPKIAVYVTGDVPNNEKEALGTRMLASLVNSGRYITIERSNSFLSEIEKEHIKQRSGAIDDSQISELGKMYGVKFVCIAAITPAFGEFQVSARIVDVETAQVIFIGESASSLKSLADLARVSDQVVRNMFGGQAAGARKPAAAGQASQARAETPASEKNTRVSSADGKAELRNSIGVRPAFGNAVNVDLQLTFMTNGKRRRHDLMLGYFGDYVGGFSSNFELVYAVGWPIDITSSGSAAMYISPALASYIGGGFNFGAGGQIGAEYILEKYMIGVDFRPVYYFLDSDDRQGFKYTVGLSVRYRI